MDDSFTIEQVGGLWVITSAEIILGHCPTVSQVIEKAVTLANKTASYGRTAQVVMFDPNGERTVIWDSTRDAYTPLDDKQ